MKLLEMGNDMKIKHSVSSLSYNVWGNFFRKKALHGGTNVCGKFMGECFIWRQMVRSCKGGGELMVKRFQKLSQVTLPLIDHDLGY